MRLVVIFILASLIVMNSFAATIVVKREPELGEMNYRVQVERLLDGNDGMDIRRIRIWSLKPREIHVHVNWPNMVNVGRTEPEPGSKVHRVDILIVVSFQGAERPLGGVPQLALERTIRIGGKRATIDRLEATVPATTELSKIVDIRVQSGIYDVGKRVTIGKLFKDVVELEIAK